MHSMFTAAISLSLALVLAAPVSAETRRLGGGQQVEMQLVSLPLTKGKFLRNENSLIEHDQGLGQNPPSPVHQPGSRTRLIVAIALVGSLAGLALWLRAR